MQVAVHAAAAEKAAAFELATKKLAAERKVKTARAQPGTVPPPPHTQTTTTTPLATTWREQDAHSLVRCFLRG
jgi:hypothetical protein